MVLLHHADGVVRSMQAFQYEESDGLYRHFLLLLLPLQADTMLLT